MPAMPNWARPSFQLASSTTNMYLTNRLDKLQQNYCAINVACATTDLLSVAIPAGVETTEEGGKEGWHRHRPGWCTDKPGGVTRTAGTRGGGQYVDCSVFVLLHWYSPPDVLVFCARMRSTCSLPCCCLLSFSHLATASAILLNPILIASVAHSGLYRYWATSMLVFGPSGVEEFFTFQK